MATPLIATTLRISALDNISISSSARSIIDLLTGTRESIERCGHVDTARGSRATATRSAQLCANFARRNGSANNRARSASNAEREGLVPRAKAMSSPPPNIRARAITCSGLSTGVTGPLRALSNSDSNPSLGVLFTSRSLRFTFFTVPPTPSPTTRLTAPHVCRQTVVTVTTDPYSLAQDAADALRTHSGVDTYDIAVVLGSGWAEAAVSLGVPTADTPTADLPGFVEPSVPGHSGHVFSLTLGEHNVALFAGRVHLYEGYGPHQVVHAVRTAIFAGARTVVLTNASGGMVNSFEIGEPVLISDHLNLMNASPLEGPAPPSHLGSRFVDLADLYSSDLRTKISGAVPDLKEGVYAAFRGPHFETPAEITMARVVGADLVGMSTALEAIAAKHLGAQVVGLSLVTDVVGANTTISHEEVMSAARQAVPRLSALLATVLPLL